ncbi:MAG: hypothetical protein BMS9Abin26_1160 [Gammaproteobacteria bacterium]|nr:MAG: hypothetical protein BMS9Abin26_1160 [Gammaproteobacteria bacterium]
MSYKDDKDQTAEQWKQRYYAALEEHEKKEKESKNAQAALRRSISRLSLAADGVNAKLDTQLEHLRNTVRSVEDPVRLQNMIDQIIDVASKVKNDESTKDESNDLLSEALSEILDKVKLPKSVSKQEKILRKKIRARTDQESMINDFSHFLLEVTRETPAGETREKDGLFGKLFGKSDGTKKEQPAIHSEVIEAAQFAPSEQIENKPVVEKSETSPNIGAVLVRLIDMISFIDKNDSGYSKIKKQATSLKSKKDVMQLLGDISGLISSCASGMTAGDTDNIEEGNRTTVHEVLIQLLERLDLTSNMVDKAEALKEDWEKGMSDDELPGALKAIASLVMEMRSSLEKEKHDFEVFLKQLSENLKELDQHLTKSSQSSNDSMEDGKKLNAMVAEQVDGIESSVNDANDINDLKASVHERLKGIRTHMRSFVDKEEQRHKEAKEQVKDLKNKMQVMESQSKTLETKLIEERNQALIDPLTEVYNRLAYNERFEQEYGRWKRYGSPLTIAIWDIDFFKRINDTYGHKAGDKALRTIAQVINSNVRETDFFARFGGEEFVVLLPETTLEAAEVVAEKIRKTVEECEFHSKGDHVLITVSCGISELRRGDSMEVVFERADKNLYRAKETGRNRCISDRE